MVNSLSNNVSYYTPNDNIISNIKFLANKDLANERVQIAATRQMKKFSSLIEKGNVGKSIGLMAAALTATCGMFNYQGPLSGLSLIGTVGTLAITATFAYQNHQYQNKLTNQISLFAQSLEKINKEMAAWEEELDAIYSKSGKLDKHAQKWVDLTRRISYNIKNIINSCDSVLKLSSDDIQKMKVEEEFEILENRCSRILNSMYA